MTGWPAALYALLGSVIGGLAAILGAIIATRAADRREKAAFKRQDQRDTAFLAATVAGILERFCDDCAEVVSDDGLSQGQRDEEGCRRTQVRLPTFNPDQLQVEWRVLPADLIFPILDLPSRIVEANRIIGAAAENAFPPDYEEVFEQRQYQYAVLGIQAGSLAARLRKHAGFPPKEGDPEWDPIRHLEAERDAILQMWDRRRQEHTLALPAAP